MDVILLKDVEQVGKAGVVVHVKPGFARNYLFPQRLAVEAKPANLRAIEERTRQAQAKLTRVREQAEQLKRRLESRSLSVKLNLGEHDVAFGSITTHDIVEMLAQEGVTLEKHAIKLDEPIKTLGIYDVPVRLHPEVTATLKLWVVKA